jgi:NADH-quinone oxidoreductase subunit J
MSTQAIIFYILGAAILIFGALTVFSRMIFRSAVYLLLSLIGMAGIYIMMEMNFIAALQIIIYVGGIVVLIIFSIFLTHQAGEKLPNQKPYYIAWAAILAAFGLSLTSWVLYQYHFTPTDAPAIDHSIRNVGRQMFDYKSHGYVFPFEIISVLLLAALVGSIVIVMKDKTDENKNI